GHGHQRRSTTDKHPGERRNPGSASGASAGLPTSETTPMQLFFVLGTSNGAREESVFDVTQRRWRIAMRVLYPKMVEFGVTAGLQRGYNVVLFEGPGQMSLLFKRHIPFTPEWNKVIGPILNWVKARPDVTRCWRPRCRSTSRPTTGPSQFRR
ncbi:MAG: hypothetical protein WCI74_15430, partial [Actinomycetes bacterium]